MITLLKLAEGAVTDGLLPNCHVCELNGDLGGNWRLYVPAGICIVVLPEEGKL